MKRISILLILIPFILFSCDKDDNPNEWVENTLFLSAYYNTKTQPLACSFYVFPDGDYTNEVEEIERDNNTPIEAVAVTKNGERVKSITWGFYSGEDGLETIKMPTAGRYYIACFPSRIFSTGYKTIYSKIEKGKASSVSPIFTPESLYGNGWQEWEK